MAEIECVAAVRNYLGEGPLWSPREQALYWVDITPGDLYRWDAATGKHEVFHLGTPIGCLALRASGGLVLATKQGFGFWEATSGLKILACPFADQPDMRFNDGAVDPRGSFWAGTMQMASGQREAKGCLYRLDPDGTVHTMLTGLLTPNGTGWSPDHKTMYFTDSGTRTIYAFDYDPATGQIANQRPLVVVPAGEGVPDGLTMDNQGYIWSARWGGWKITRYDPSGTVERVLTMPVERPTSCTFGGKNFDELYVTSADLGMTDEQRTTQPLAGSILRSKPGFRGSPAFEFAG